MSCRKDWHYERFFNLWQALSSKKLHFRQKYNTFSHYPYLTCLLLPPPIPSHTPLPTLWLSSTKQQNPRPFLLLSSQKPPFLPLLTIKFTSSHPNDVKIQHPSLFSSSLFSSHPLSSFPSSTLFSSFFNLSFSSHYDVANIQQKFLGLPQSLILVIKNQIDLLLPEKSPPRLYLRPNH